MKKEDREEAHYVLRHTIGRGKAMLESYRKVGMGDPLLTMILELISDFADVWLDRLEAEEKTRRAYIDLQGVLRQEQPVGQKEGKNGNRYRIH